MSMYSNLTVTPELVAAIIQGIAGMGIDVGTAVPAAATAAPAAPISAPTSASAAAIRPIVQAHGTVGPSAPGSHNSRIDGLAQDLPSARSARLHQIIQDAFGKTDEVYVQGTADGSDSGVTATTGSPAASTCSEIFTGTGYLCQACHTWNQLRNPGEVWYVVTVGTRVGVINQWGIVQPHVIGIKTACYCRMPSEEGARSNFNTAMQAGLVKIINAQGQLIRVVHLGDDY